MKSITESIAEFILSVAILESFSLIVRAESSRSGKNFSTNLLIALLISSLLSISVREKLVMKSCNAIAGPLNNPVNAIRTVSIAPLIPFLALSNADEACANLANSFRRNSSLLSLSGIASSILLLNSLIELRLDIIAAPISPPTSCATNLKLAMPSGPIVAILSLILAGIPANNSSAFFIEASSPRATRLLMSAIIAVTSSPAAVPVEANALNNACPESL